MLLVVGGRELEVVDHRSARLRDLVDLQDGTRRWVPGGLRQHALEDLARAARSPGFADTEDGELWHAAVVFLSRRAAGDAGRFAALTDCTAAFAVEAGDAAPGDVEALREGPGTTGARWPGDTRTRRRPAAAAGEVSSWPFDDVAQSLAEWLLPVSHYWPGITPLNVLDLPAHWWAAYLIGARQLAEAHGK
jgi:hypothetical protein